MQPQNSQAQRLLAQSAYLASGVSATLSNPYAPQQLPNYHTYSSHYAQAYLQAFPSTTSDGYTISSTYNHSSSFANAYNAFSDTRTKSTHKPTLGQSSNNSWYQPGNIKCAHNNCPFIGSAKSVEIHKMDRHLIYPPGWERRKKRPEWDADPSLKGKKIPIQGTTIVLDSPDVLEAWIKERRQRWPSSARVEEKKRKLQEAAERGQLAIEDINFHSSKRQKLAKPSVNPQTNLNHRCRHSPRPCIPHTTTCLTTSLNLHSKTEESFQSNSTDDIGSDQDDSPEILSSKASAGTSDAYPTSPTRSKKAQHVKSRQTSSSSLPQQIIPKQIPRNPFSSRPTLLHNLLLPEIRVTISNVSQAIRFLVDNNFLDGIEVIPGEAESKMIQVLENSETNKHV